MTTWSTVAALVDTLQVRWDRGHYLRQYASGEPWVPISMPVRGPSAGDLADNLPEVVRWEQQFRAASKTGSARERFAVEYKTIRGKGLGSNQIPSRVRIETFDDLCRLLSVRHVVDQLDDVIDATTAGLPALTPWVVRNPLEALHHTAIWPDVLALVRWISENDTRDVFVRQIDVGRIDTKFVEQNRKLLGKLLIEVLPADQVDLGRNDFAGRFGMAVKPTYTRFRLLDSDLGLPGGLTELQLRTDEFAEFPIEVDTVFIVENEISYLAFPPVTKAICIFGSGYGATSLESLTWLDSARIVYWGDIDTHGLAILSRLRERFPRLKSMLMDVATLVGHSDKIVSEPRQTTDPQPFLTSEEASLFEDLRSHRYGPSARLEQERIGFSFVHDAINQLELGR